MTASCFPPTATLEGSWGDEAQWVATAEDAEDYLMHALQPGDIVLFKSSNAAGLNHLGDRVAAAASGQAATSNGTIDGTGDEPA